MPGGTEAVGGHERTGWAAVTALVAVAWGTPLMWVAQRIGFVRRPPAADVVTAAGPARGGMPAGTRMALQMAAASAAAFTAGRMLWPDHWAWVVLTAFLVCSGARSRADALVKGVWRTVGASVGTVVAGAVAGSFGPRSDAVVVLIFAVLTVATWLRELSYAYWAGCVTAVLSPTTRAWAGGARRWRRTRSPYAAPSAAARHHTAPPDRLHWRRPVHRDRKRPWPWPWP
ncbi:FUSC family protein [Streptomyces sp. NEAU-YJ-81]|uniref:FUSC family protein n=1 Tax=Streptomyces sp. NEAU-YJ-81 TaxID=2820288 RepID=UPI001ABCBC52|nr:FUSC family protein [Streptomyces sp. NEAU-YJ-81]MBO3675613.1 FUSC family protein [Streptomyces sp. NEAU-YJ-81]